jgi:hypothetical protein
LGRHDLQNSIIEAMGGQGSVSHWPVDESLRQKNYPAVLVAEWVVDFFDLYSFYDVIIPMDVAPSFQTIVISDRIRPRLSPDRLYLLESGARFASFAMSKKYNHASMKAKWKSSSKRVWIDPQTPFVQAIHDALGKLPAWKEPAVEGLIQDIHAGRFPAAHR